MKGDKRIVEGFFVGVVWNIFYLVSFVRGVGGVVVRGGEGLGKVLWRGIFWFVGY